MIFRTFLFLLVVKAGASRMNKWSTAQETVLPGNPFVAIWNAPSEVCQTHFGVNLNLSAFDIVANKNVTFEGNEIVIYYKLGLFPFYTPGGVPENGGLPQLANLSTHLDQVRKDVELYIPDSSFTGLAVIDWEAWRPIFERNHYNVPMRIYIEKSEDLVRQAHPTWPEDKIKLQATSDFESAARTFLLQTIMLCEQLRPGGKWGYYSYPECYNDRVGEQHCDTINKYYNDQLHWMFVNSGALLPSIYLSETFGTADDRRLQVFGRLEEALRVIENNSRAVIVPYTRFRYRDTLNFYQLGDLRNSIQQSVDAGLAGIALWGSSASFRTKSQCEATRDYIDVTLGPFVKNATVFAMNCSISVCNSHGRCFRSDWHKSVNTKTAHPFNSNEYKQSTITSKKKVSFQNILRKVSPWNYIVNVFRKYFLKRFITDFDEIIRASKEKKKALLKKPGKYSDYKCRCYAGWTGEFCDKTSI